MSVAVAEEGAGQEQKGEGEEEAGACPLEPAGLQGGEDSGKDSVPAQDREEEEVGVAFWHQRLRMEAEDSTYPLAGEDLLI